MTTYITPFKYDDVKLSKNGLTFWKQILPQGQIKYEGQSLNFDGAYINDLVDAFKDKAIGQTPFVLADKDNAHTMDPERFRGEVVDMRPAVSGEAPGLYAKIKFSAKEHAQAVLSNPHLGVSARITSNRERADDGKSFKRAIVHVLGTLDPKVTRLSPWQAVELSEYDTVVLDLSRATYPEGAEMAKKTETVQVPSLDEITEDEIENLTDEQIQQFLIDNEINAEDIEDETDESDEDEDESDEDEDDETEDASTKELEPALSNTATSDIELANATAQAANSRANEALKRMAAAEWRETRLSYVNAGVPPFMLDLAAPVLSRPHEMEVDLSNSGDKPLNVSAILTKMLEGAKGTIDMSNPVGHNGTGDNGDTDPDKEMLLAWDAQFPA